LGDCASLGNTDEPTRSALDREVEVTPLSNYRRGPLQGLRGRARG